MCFTLPSSLQCAVKFLFQIVECSHMCLIMSWISWTTWTSASLFRLSSKAIASSASLGLSYSTWQSSCSRTVKRQFFSSGSHKWFKCPPDVMFELLYPKRGNTPECADKSGRMKSVLFVIRMRYAALGNFRSPNSTSLCQIHLSNKRASPGSKCWSSSWPSDFERNRNQPPPSWASALSIGTYTVRAQASLGITCHAQPSRCQSYTWFSPGTLNDSSSFNMTISPSHLNSAANAPTNVDAKHLDPLLKYIMFLQ